MRAIQRAIQGTLERRVTGGTVLWMASPAGKVTQVFKSPTWFSDKVAKQLVAVRSLPDGHFSLSSSRSSVPISRRTSNAYKRELPDPFRRSATV